MKTYNLNVKKVVLSLLLLIVMILYLVRPIIIKNFIMHTGGVSYMPSVALIICVCWFIYFFRLLIYKRKEVLTITEDKIVYFNPAYKKFEISKENISDLYITGYGILRILCKEEVQRKTISSRFWSWFWHWFTDVYDYKKLFDIDLNFIKCDKEEILKLILRLDEDYNGAKIIMEDKMKKYALKDLNDFKVNKEALKECVEEIYELEVLAQYEIAKILDVEVKEVSKIIQNYLNEKN